MNCSDFRSFYGIKDNWFPCCNDCHALEQEFGAVLYSISIQNKQYNVCCSLADFYYSSTILKWIIHTRIIIVHTFKELMKGIKG